MEVVALIVGLIAAAVVLPALLVLCGAKRKHDAPVGASMAHRRRGAAGGAMLQIDPLLQPNWAAKQAEREAQEKKQLAVIMSSKQARLHRVGAGGGDDPVQVVMRQPSTMADKFALPSHLTKQLGQPSRRGLASGAPGGGGIRSGTPLQDGSVEGIPPLPDRKSQSSPMYGGYGGSVSSVSRSVVNDSSINVSAGRDTSDYLHARGLNSNTSNGSRRGVAADPTKALRASSATAPYPVAVGVIPVGEMYPLDGSGTLPRDLREVDSDRRVSDPRVATSVPFAGIGSGSGTGIAWPRLDENSDDDTVQGRTATAAAAAAVPMQGSLSAGGVAATAAAALEGPRLSHPRVAALSPVLGATFRERSRSGSGSGSGDGSRPGARVVNAFQVHPQQLQPYPDDDEQPDGPGERQLQSGESRLSRAQRHARSSADDVEQLVPGVDWAAAAPDMDAGSRRGGLANRQGLPPSVPPGYPPGSPSPAPVSDSSAAAAATYRQLLGGPDNSIGGGGASGGAGGGRTISSRELHARGPHLRSPLGSFGDSRDTRMATSATISGGAAAGISKRWTANGSLSPPAPAVTTMALELEAPLPGSSDHIAVVVTGGNTPASRPGPGGAPPQNSLMSHRSHKSLTAMRTSGTGARLESRTWGGGVQQTLEGRSGRRRLGGDECRDGQTEMGTVASASAAATAAAAAAAKAAAARGTPVMLGTPPSSAESGAGRGATTWSGMAVAPLVDVEAGPVALTSSGDGSAAAAAAWTSRTARAQALLARNRSNLSRLAASAATRTSVTLS